MTSLSQVEKKARASKNEAALPAEDVLPAHIALMSRLDRLNDDFSVYIDRMRGTLRPILIVAPVGETGPAPCLESLTPNSGYFIELLSKIQQLGDKLGALNLLLKDMEL